MQHRIRTALDWIQWSRIPVFIKLTGMKTLKQQVCHSERVSIAMYVQHCVYTHCGKSVSDYVRFRQHVLEKYLGKDISQFNSVCVYEGAGPTA
jgi:hypothetical protein